MSNKSRRKGPGGGQPSRGRSGPPPVATPSARRRLELFSAPILMTLHSLPRWLVPVLMAVILFLGLVLAGPYTWIGALLLVVVGLFITWLTALSWPILTGGGRIMRVVVVVAVFGLAVLKVLGRF